MERKIIQKLFTKNIIIYFNIFKVIFNKKKIDIFFRETIIWNAQDVW